MYKFMECWKKYKLHTFQVEAIKICLYNGGWTLDTLAKKFDTTRQIIQTIKKNEKYNV